MALFLQSLPTVIILIAAFCGRNWLVARIKSGVEHDFNSKLENLKGELRAKENEISTLRDTVFTGRNQRQALVEKRKIEAIEAVWKSVVELGKFKALAGAMAIVKFEAASQEISKNPNVKHFFETVAKLAPKVEDMSTISAPNERPFISPVAWAYFSALQAVLTGAYAKVKILEAGVQDSHKLINHEREKKLLITALPHQKSYIEQYDSTTYYYLIDELEEKLLKELQNMLAGKESDAENVQRAKELQKQIKENEADSVSLNV
ncbi:MAG: hypothetical protein FJX23_07580 [Alphaproteobacteria bacterium]|nr:hypothetical protein [Alphaproteobacteria bacterium]